MTTAPGRGSSRSTTSSTVTIDRDDASTVSFCTPVMPQSWTLPSRSACCAWMMPTSGRCAGTAASSSPVNGHVIVATRVRRGQISAAVTAQNAERQVRRGRRIRGRHARVRVLLELELPRPVVLDRVPQAVQRADARVAAPREDELAGAGGSDQLVVDHVRRHPHKRQVAPLLPDKLVPRRVRNQAREALESDGVPISHEFRDGLRQGDDLSQRCCPSRWFPVRSRSAWPLGLTVAQTSYTRDRLCSPLATSGER